MDKERVKTVVALMTLDEKVALTSADAKGCTAALPRLKVPALKLPKEEDALYSGKYVPFFALAHTFDSSLVRTFARMRCRDAYISGESYGGEVALGVIRNPYAPEARRAFSDEPNLSSALAGEYAAACDLPPVGVDVLGVNGFDRYIDKRTAAEIYLYPYLKNKDALGALALPSGRLNGVPAGENREFVSLVTDGFDALVFTRAGSTSDKAEEVSSGACLGILPPPESGTRLKNAVESGLLYEKKLDRCVERNVLAAAECYKRIKNFTPPAITAAEAECAYNRLASESAVLMKNDGVLPLTPSDTAVVGAKIPCGRHIAIKPDLRRPEKSADKTAKAAGECKTVVIAAENADTSDPAALSEFVERLSKTSKIVVVAAAAHYFEIPCLSKADAFVYVPTDVISDPAALAALLTGEDDFTGRLCCRWAQSEKNYPFAPYAARDCYTGERTDISCRGVGSVSEGADFKAGYGLSLYEAEADNFTVAKDGADIEFSFDVRGETECEKSVVVYSSYGGGDTRIAAFGRTFVCAEKKTYRLRCNRAALEVFDTQKNAFVVRSGEYTFTAEIGRVRLTAVMTADGEKSFEDNETVSERFSPEGVDFMPNRQDGGRADKALAALSAKTFRTKAKPGSLYFLSPDARINAAAAYKRQK